MLKISKCVRFEMESVLFGVESVRLGLENVRCGLESVLMKVEMVYMSKFCSILFRFRLFIGVLNCPAHYFILKLANFLSLIALVANKMVPPIFVLFAM
jgi:hypothetical protein